MKKLFLLFTVIVLSSGMALCATENKKEETMESSYQKQSATCRNVARNFRADSQFFGYLQNRCLLYDIDRQRFLSLLFPVTSKSGAEYKNTRLLQMTTFAIEMDKEQIAQTQKIVTQYCKNNQYKLEKKSPEACSKVESLFKLD